jgi:CO/xanthine dehydrogenase Mo-binding subunit
MHRVLQSDDGDGEGAAMTIGLSLPRIDAVGKVTGDAIYPADLKPTDTLHGKVVFTNQPHARLVRLDVSRALAMPGVVDVVTAADVPVNEYGLTMFDQPVLIGPGSKVSSQLECNVSRWEADQLAVVIAQTPEQAIDGAAEIEADWEQIPVVSDIDSAIKDQALVHAESGTNAYLHYKLRKGDIGEGWRLADVVVEATYELPLQEHAYLQPEAAVSYIDQEGRVTVEIAGQWIHEDQAQIAHALGIDPDRVRVIYPSVGGAFGGREDMSLQIVMALAVWKLHQRGIDRPVRAVWSREESIVGHHKRHRGRVHARWGATNQGKVVAVESLAHLDAGAYNYTTNKVLGNLHLSLAGPYRIPHAHIDSFGVYTNTVPGGAFRGFGAPQGALVAESQMNKLAAELGIDPVEIRRRNCLQEGSIGITQAELPPAVGVGAVIEACAEAFGWPELGPAEEMRPFASLPSSPASVRRGRGFAASMKNIGFSFGFDERCEAVVELHGESEIERVVLHHAGAEVGQGAHTVFRQMAAEAVGIELDLVEAHYSDTASTGDSGSASASRLTWMAGNSILGATEEAQKRWNEGDRPAVGHFRYVPPPTEALDAEDGTGNPVIAYGYAAEAVALSIDIDTGHIQVDRVVCADDVGRVINPNLVEGQVEGAVVQAHGYTITEDLQVREGHIINPRLSGYLIPGIGDIPIRVETVIVEIPDPRGPWGAKGMAEMPLIPYAPAVIAALHDATGVWFHQIPLTPSRVVAELRKHGVGGGRAFG